MSLYKRGEVWHYDFCMAGQRYRGSTKETVHSRARKVEALLMAEARDRGYSLIPRRAPVLSEFAARFLQWVESSQLEPSTQHYYRTGWQLLQGSSLTGMRLDCITTDVTTGIQLGRSPANTNCALRTLRRMLGKAEEWNVVRAAPRIRLAKEQGRSMLIDSDTEQRLLAVANQPLRDALCIILDTGMRPGEVFRMRWENVNWEMQNIAIPFGKTRSSRRVVPISERVRELLLARSNEQQEGWVFPAASKSGHIETVQKQFRQARLEAGVSAKVVLYCARHTFATHALAATGNLAAVMKALGHSNVQTAMIYQHPALDAIREAVDAKNLAASERHKLRHSDAVVQ